MGLTPLFLSIHHTQANGLLSEAREIFHFRPAAQKAGLDLKFSAFWRDPSRASATLTLVRPDVTVELK